MIYFFLIFLTVFGGYFTRRLKKPKKAYCYILFIAFSLIIGLRHYSIGTDTYSYVFNFLRAKGLSETPLYMLLDYREFLFLLFRNIVREFTDSYTIYLLLIAFFYMGSVLCFIYKYSTIPSISVLLFMSMGYFSFCMSGLRQTIAMGIFIIAVMALQEKKYIKCAILLLIATGFHISSIIYFAALIAYFLPLNKIYISVCTLLTALFAANGGRYIQIATDYLWGSDRNYSGNDSGSGTVLFLLISIAVFCLAFYKNMIDKKAKNRSQNGALSNKVSDADRFFMKLLLISIPFQSLALINANAFRIAIPFHFFHIALLPNVINKVRNRNTRIIGKATIIILLIAFFYISTYPSNNLSPYYFYWQK